jgi:hypothetical protein
MSPETQRADNLRGILMMILAVGSFAMMDAALKLLTPHYPATQVAALRDRFDATLANWPGAR